MKQNIYAVTNQVTSMSELEELPSQPAEGLLNTQQEDSQENVHTQELAVALGIGSVTGLILLAGILVCANFCCRSLCPHLSSSRISEEEVGLIEADPSSRSL